MPKKWGVNSKAEEARERDKNQKKEKKVEEEEKKESQKWEDNDKSVLSKMERKKEQEAKKLEEQQRKLENKKLYEEEMNAVITNKKAKPEKLTKAQIKKNEEEALMKALEKKFGGEKKASRDHSEDSSEDPDLEPNLNHIQREKALEDEQKYSQVIDARGLDDALGQLNIDRPDKHPEKRVRAAFEKYTDEQMPILKAENPGLKRSQLLEILHKNWKKAPENPFNQNTATYDTKV